MESFRLNDKTIYRKLENALPFNDKSFFQWFKQNRGAIEEDERMGEQLVQIMNRFLIACTEGSQHLYWIFEKRTIEESEILDWSPISISKAEGLFKKYSFLFLHQGEKKARVTTVFRYWSSHESQRNVTSLTFHPQLPCGFLKREEEMGEDLVNEYIIFNKWVGYEKKFTRELEEWEQELAEERLARILFHIKEVISRGNEKIYDFITEWMASVIQRPWKKIHIVLVVSGLQGAGKSIFWEFFSKIFGIHGLVTPDSDLITHKFYGAELSTKVFVVTNETNFKHSKEANALKNQITSEFRKAEKKGQDIGLKKDFVNMVWTSNDPLNSFPVERGTNRRYFSVEADGSRSNRKDYFDELAEAFQGDNWIGLRALFHYLNSRELGSVDLNLPPHTEEKSDAISAQFDDFETWWLNCLRAKAHHRPMGGDFTMDPEEKHWITKGADKEQLWNNFQFTLSTRNKENWGNQTRFESEMKRILPPLDPELPQFPFAETEKLFTMPLWRSCWEYFHSSKGLVNPLKETILNRKRKLVYDKEKDDRKITRFFRRRGEEENFSQS